MNNLSAMTDHDLAELYEQGNDIAFDELLRRHQDYVYSYILFVCKNEDTAQDVFQDTFMRAIMAIRQASSAHGWYALPTIWPLTV